MNPLAHAIAEPVAEALGLEADPIASLVTTPPDDSLGDYALPCFALAQELGRNPAEIAAELAETLQAPSVALVAEAEAAGPYLNVTIERGALMRHTAARALKEGTRFGGSELGKGQTIVIDYSSPNVARPFSVGHLRSTVLGHALKRIYRHRGYEVIGVNHLGDWGTQFGALLAAYDRWGSPERIEQDQVYELFRLYVEFHERAESEPDLEAEARAWFQRLEAGDAEAIERWEWIVEQSLQAFEQYYRMLGIDFEEVRGESAYRDQTGALIDDLLQRGIAAESEGAIVIPFGEADDGSDGASEDDATPPLILRKSDGTTVYATRDLCAAIYHHQTYGFAWKLYVVDAGQSLHFQQFFEALARMGYAWADRLVHVAFGIVLFEDQRMSTRKGRVVFFEDVAEQAIARTRETIESIAKIAEMPEAEKDAIAERVGVSAVIYATLSRSRTQDINFRWDEVLSFEGRSGPYIQYTHARLAGVLRKAEREVPTEPAYERLTHPNEVALAKLIGQFPERLDRAAEQYDPFPVAEHLGELAAAANKFYDTCRVLGEPPELEGARLALVQSAQTVLKTGLDLVGMAAPERM